MTVTTTSEKSHATRLFNLCRLTTPLIKILRNLDKPFAHTCGGHPVWKHTRTTMLVRSPLPGPGRRSGHTPTPSAFIILKAKRGVSVPLQYLPHFLCPPQFRLCTFHSFLHVRLVSASGPLQYLQHFVCLPLFQLRTLPRFLRVRLVSASVPLQYLPHFLCPPQFRLHTLFNFLRVRLVVEMCRKQYEKYTL